MNEPFSPIVIVDSAIAGEAIETRHQLEQVISSMNRSKFDIAELLLKIKRKGYYAPYATFDEFRTSLKIKKRTSQYLTKMAAVMEEVGIPRSQYEPLGVSRLRDITSLEPTDIWTNPISGAKTPMRDFIIGFVEYRHEVTGDFIDPELLKRNVRTLKGFVGENDFEFFTFSFQRSTLETVVRPALELAKAHLGSVKKDDEGISQDATDSSAAVAIFADYLSDPTNDFANLTESEMDSSEPEDNYEDNSEVTI
jgi:hypothetical protein